MNEPLEEGIPVDEGDPQGTPVDEGNPEGEPLGGPVGVQEGVLLGALVVKPAGGNP